ncbi:MAG: hypothetical protein AAF705_15710 [Bacteroidota bacterium]
MKKLFYLTSIAYVICCLALLKPSCALGQSKSIQSYTIDYPTHKMLLASKSVNTQDAITLDVEPVNLRTESTLLHQEQSVLTGPGKVVAWMVFLSCLFFYCNRKK